VLITHMMNWTGQVIPAREIAAEARKRNILSIIDGAQSFAQRDYRVSELGADFYGTSLHKWLCAPLGTGMLHVRKDRIADLWPLFPGSDPRSDNIRKFENLGTRSMAVKHAIGTAIDFHHTIGIARKQARLHYLKNYWVDQIKDESRIRIWTPQHAQFSGAIATVSIEGVTGVKLNRRLLTDYAIHTSRVTHEGIDGVRIAPHIYTNTYELDVLVDRLRKIATG
ncbi:MAG: aminotransferase class V-fold PLP-dependent enzyme, partial [Bacteroidota bacterium]